MSIIYPLQVKNSCLFFAASGDVAQSTYRNEFKSIGGGGIFLRLRENFREAKTLIKKAIEEQGEKRSKDIFQQLEENHCHYFSLLDQCEQRYPGKSGYM
ncbi:MAG: hypothetical protein ACHQHP_05705, partial [Bacteroidia bacterium]